MGLTTIAACALLVLPQMAQAAPSEEEIAAAQAAGDAKKIAEAEAALTARRAWLEQVLRSAKA